MRVDLKPHSGPVGRAGDPGSLSDKGHAALREYAQTPVGFTPLKSEPLLRLLICDLLGEADTLKSMAALR